MKTFARISGAILAGIVLLFCARLWAADTSVLPSVDFSAPGPLTVEILEFPDLVDVGRTGNKPPGERPRLFSRLRRNAEQQENLATGKGRRIPIKIHAPTTGGPYPIVIVSHGAGGNWDTHYAQAQHLASHGYVVFCLEHVGSNTERMKSSIRWIANIKTMAHDANEVLGRPKDVSFALDRAAEWNALNEKLRGRLDLNNVGILGHSYGAYTTMAVCGMRPALNWLEPPVAPGKGVGPDLHDARVKCGIALSPLAPGEPFFIRESFVTLRVPLLGISGTKDKQEVADLPPMNRYQAFDLWPKNNGQNIFVWLANASHLDFSDTTGSRRGNLPSSTRGDVQPIVRAATLLFFNMHLKADPAAAAKLTTNGLKPYLRGAIDSVEVRKK